MALVVEGWELCTHSQDETTYTLVLFTFVFRPLHWSACSVRRLIEFVIYKGKILLIRVVQPSFAQVYYGCREK